MRLHHVTLLASRVHVARMFQINYNYTYQLERYKVATRNTASALMHPKCMHCQEHHGIIQVGHLIDAAFCTNPRDYSVELEI